MNRAHIVAGGNTPFSTMNWCKQIIAPWWSGAYFLLSMLSLVACLDFFDLLVYFVTWFDLWKDSLHTSAGLLIFLVYLQG